MVECVTVRALDKALCGRKKWINCCACSLKKKFKADYVKVRKHFDKEVQKAKRIYWFPL